MNIRECMHSELRFWHQQPRKEGIKVVQVIFSCFAPSQETVIYRGTTISFPCWVVFGIDIAINLEKFSNFILEISVEFVRSSGAG